MSALEKEIIEKFRQLTPENRAQMLSILQEEVASQQVSLTAWLAEVEAVRFTSSRWSRWLAAMCRENKSA